MSELKESDGITQFSSAIVQTRILRLAGEKWLPKALQEQVEKSELYFTSVKFASGPFCYHLDKFGVLHRFAPRSPTHSLQAVPVHYEETGTPGIGSSWGFWSGRWSDENSFFSSNGHRKHSSRKVPAGTDESIRNKLFYPASQPTQLQSLLIPFASGLSISSPGGSKSMAGWLFYQ